MSREQLLYQYAPLIKSVVRRYSHIRHCLFSEEDIMSEAFLVFSTVVGSCSEEDFGKVFRASLYNHMKSLFKRHFHTNRVAFTVDISEAVNLVGENHLEKIFLREEIEHLCSLLPAFHRKVLYEMVDPSTETLLRAEKDYIRGRHLYNRNVINYRYWRVSRRNVANTLGVSVNTLHRSLRVLKETIRGEEEGEA